MRARHLLISALTAGVLLGGNLYAKTIDSDAALDRKGEGFYFYEDPDSNTTKPVPVTPTQKMQAQMMEKLIQKMEENNRLQAKILEKLEYAYPRTIPEFTTNKKTGKKCRSNSSADCFVMPVIAEAQNSVPVMAEMLRNPTATNVKEYIKWQAQYFNQTFKVGQGFNLMGKQYEREIHSVDGMGFTQLPQAGDRQNEMANLARTAVVKKLDDKLGVMFFIGKTRELEKDFSGKEYSGLLHTAFGKMKNFTYVFNSQEDIDFVRSKIARYKYDSDIKLFDEAKKIVAPEQFKRFKINATPASVAIYKKDDGDIVWQKLGYSYEPRAMLRTIYQFLQFHNIIKPGTINEQYNWSVSQTIRNNGDMNQAEVNQIELHEEDIVDIPEDQYLHKKSEKK